MFEESGAAHKAFLVSHDYFRNCATALMSAAMTVAQNASMAGFGLYSG
jgi:hypothetical protein